MTGARRTLLAAVGVAGVAVAVGVAVGLAPSALVGAADGLDATLATGVLGAGLVGYAFRRRRASPTTETQRLADATARPEPPAPGESVDDALRRITEHGDAAFTQDAQSDVRECVRETAVRAYAHAASVSASAAADAVASGEWTDDRTAAAFVGDERAPHYPLRERLRGWLQPERAFRRRARRAADAAHALATDADAVSDGTEGSA
ncbi:MAG: hypothetical protein ABEH83_04600 [Halobacterium sp.]